MKNILYLIICAFVTLTAVADGLPVTQEQLSNDLTSSSSFTHYKMPFSIKHPFLKRLDLHPEYLDTEDGRIVMVDCYDFNWNSTNGTATVINSSRFRYGKSTCLKSLVDPNGNWIVKIQDLYMQYDIPIDIDENSRKVTLYTGKLLTTLMFSSTTRYDVYAMPEKWLTTLDAADDYSDIVGQIYRDGSIEFSDGFAFLIEKKIMHDGGWETSSWELSPIFRNLHLFVPNGKHTYTARDLPESERPKNPSQHGGGLVPRNPRPVKPKPVNSKPVNPRAFDPKLTLGNPSDATTGFDMIPLSSVTDQEFQIPLNDINDNRDGIIHSVPVYILQTNDSTIYVYNLYGTDFNWNYMVLNHDGTMTFPYQEVGRDGGDGLYNFSCRDNEILSGGNQGTWHDNTLTQMIIEWDDTYFDYEYEGMSPYLHLPVEPELQFRNNRKSLRDSVYMDNRLVLTKPLNPSFRQPLVTDSTVTFRAAVTQSLYEVLLLLYDPEQDVYSSVPNPYTVYRTDTAYSVSLVAYTRRALDGGKYTYSDDVYFEYEVPALTQAEQGDVNNDGAVDITDVTSLINQVLETTDTVDGLSPKHIDVNLLEDIDIEDITNLIHRVLFGDWPTKECR